MTYLTNTQKRIRELIGVGHWWSRRQLTIMWIGYDKDRHKLMHENLLSLYKKKAIKRRWFKGYLIYSTSGSNRQVEHGTVCAEVIMRIFMANPEAEIIGEGVFRQYRLGNVPEAGFKYPNGDLLLFEYCTRDNAKRSGLVSRKVKAYQKTITNMEKTFDGRGVVIFIIDLPIFEVKQMAGRYLKDTNFIYFADAKSFFDLPLGKALTAEIYFMANGEREALHV